ncbi:liver-expressed antimicrobial peptide 2 [Chanos chanos]|uniref:Liver-expressed antimicrobial peptide 2 n=1 Tax=Chanos chanos TaxID=29144 RepID=A0A6J2USR8_CHACN|nr:liver-expressed antimicrobial peptide 2-like [Chanos chanos]
MVSMNPIRLKLLAVAMLLSLLCAMEVQTAPLEENWASGIIHRAKRSLLWRWNTLKPVGASCRHFSECATNYCRRNVCTFPSVSS